MSLEARVALRKGTLDLDVGLDVESSGVVVLLGPNAAGKTTLLRALAGLVPLERGRVALDGVVLEDTAAGVRVPTERRPIGVVFQDYLLFPHMTALENVAFGLRSRGTARASARARAHDLLEQVGLADIAGGQAQGALGRPGAAGGAGASARHRSAPPAARRAALGHGRRSPRRAAARPLPAPRRLSRHLPRHHSRPYRGHDARRQARRARGGQGRPGGHARGTLVPPPLAVRGGPARAEPLPRPRWTRGRCC